MSEAFDKARQSFEAAFELAFCIHVNKEIAFFVAEDALESLSTTLGFQKKNRIPSEGLRGFQKWGERARPIRTTVELSERQMLQWLVYKHSESWERRTETGEGLYVPNDEDMIVRFIEYLVFLTLRRGSFYVTLATCPILHQFDRRETRLFYDILTQDDAARMKDTNYIGKQRLEMLEKVSERFGEMVKIAKGPSGDKQFIVQPATQGLIDLVKESLKRFTPWDSTCVVNQTQDVTDVSGLAFSESAMPNEERVEINRIHTVLHPECFDRFLKGLANYVGALPDKDADKTCRYESPEKRLAVPEFSNVPGGKPRGDRFQSPMLAEEDYIRLERTLDARAQRKKIFKPQQLRVYLDDELLCTIDATLTNKISRTIRTIGVVEVRGLDDTGELVLASLVLDAQFLSGDGFSDSVIHSGGQKLSLSLTQVSSGDGLTPEACLEVSNRVSSGRFSIANSIRRGLAWLAGSDSLASEERTDRVTGGVRWARVGIVMLAIAIAGLIWWRLAPGSLLREATVWKGKSAQPNKPEVETSDGNTSPEALPSPRQSPMKQESTLLARASWNLDRGAVLNAIPVEATRSEIRTVSLADREAKFTISVPIYDNSGRTYSRYRLTLSAPKKRLWQVMLRSPQRDATAYVHLLDVALDTRRLQKEAEYELTVEGAARDGWSRIGRLVLRSE